MSSLSTKGETGLEPRCNLVSMKWRPMPKETRMADCLLGVHRDLPMNRLRNLRMRADETAKEQKFQARLRSFFGSKSL